MYGYDSVVRERGGQWPTQLKKPRTHWTRKQRLRSNWRGQDRQTPGTRRIISY